MSEGETQNLNEECVEEYYDDLPEETNQEPGNTENIEDDSANNNDEGESAKKPKFFGKDKNKKADKNQERIDELEDRVKRQMAEFDNYRKRSEKEKSVSFEIGAKSVLEKILPVIDNFERGIATIPEDEANKPFAEGMTAIYRQLTAELDKLEVKPIEALGQPFNPDLHNAVMQTESEEYEEGTVAQELQKGYMYRDTVLRHSMVAVVG